MEIPALVRMPNLGRVYAVQPVFRGDVRCNVVIEPLEGIGHVAVFIDLPVQVLDVVLN